MTLSVGDYVNVGGKVGIFVAAHDENTSLVVFDPAKAPVPVSNSDFANLTDEQRKVIKLYFEMVMGPKR